MNSGDSTFVNAATVMVAQWAAVGIKAEVQTVDFATLMSVAGTRDYDILAVQYTYALWILIRMWRGCWVEKAAGPVTATPRWTKLSGPHS